MNSNTPTDLRFLSLYKALGDELQQAIAAYSASDQSQYHRRTMFRTLFAVAEGLCSTLKRVALDWEEDPVEDRQVRFSQAELAALREDDYSVDNKGSISARPKKVPLLPNLRLAIGLFLKTYGIAESVAADYQDPRWGSLKRSQAVRNRLMHPRSAEDLNVSDYDWKQVGEGFAWLTETIARAFCAVEAWHVHSMQSDRATRQELQRQVEQEIAAGNITRAEYEELVHKQKVWDVAAGKITHEEIQRQLDQAVLDAAGPDVTEEDIRKEIYRDVE